MSYPYSYSFLHHLNCLIFYVQQHIPFYLYILSTPRGQYLPNGRPPYASDNLCSTYQP